MSPLGSRATSVSSQSPHSVVGRILSMRIPVPPLTVMLVYLLTSLCTSVVASGPEGCSAKGRLAKGRLAKGRLAKGHLAKGHLAKGRKQRGLMRDDTYRAPIFCTVPLPKVPLVPSKVTYIPHPRQAKYTTAHPRTSAAAAASHRRAALAASPSTMPCVRPIIIHITVYVHITYPYICIYA